MSILPELKIEDTRRTNEATQNSQPFAICLNNPDPAVRAFIMKVMEKKDPISLDYNVVRKSGALLEQNTKNILRITFKDNVELFKKHLEIDYTRWHSVQQRFGLLDGIIKKIEEQFKDFEPKSKHNKLSI